MKITPRQLDCLRLVAIYHARYDRPPPRWWLDDQLGYAGTSASTGCSWQLLAALRRRGLVGREGITEAGRLALAKEGAIS